MEYRHMDKNQKAESHGTSSNRKLKVLLRLRKAEAVISATHTTDMTLFFAKPKVGEPLHSPVHTDFFCTCFYSKK